MCTVVLKPDRLQWLSDGARASEGDLSDLVLQLAKLTFWLVVRMFIHDDTTHRWNCCLDRPAESMSSVAYGGVICHRLYRRLSHKPVSDMGSDKANGNFGALGVAHY